jgi:hypothetical protein
MHAQRFVGDVTCLGKFDQNRLLCGEDVVKSLWGESQPGSTCVFAESTRRNEQ